VNETGFSLVNWDADAESAVNELKLFNKDEDYDIYQELLR